MIINSYFNLNTCKFVLSAFLIIGLKFAKFFIPTKTYLTLLRVELVFKYQLLFKTVLHYDALS